jgi:hypothetical protein
MSAPLIDLRNYEQVVEQTERLARAFTAVRQAAKPNTLDTINGLAGHILYEDVLNPGEPAAILTAPDGTEYRSGTRLTFALAQVLVQQPGIDSVMTLGWGPAADQPDMGRALIQIFGRMVSSIIDRLNQVPDKSFLTFLNLIGTRLAPPQPARVPLTFLLAPKAPMDARVPAGTPVAAPPGENESQEIGFETERDLNVSRAALISAFVHDPIQDFYQDASEIAVGSSPISGATFKVFEGTRPIQHTLYIANDAILAAPGSKTVIVSLQTPDAAALSQLLPLIGWAFFDSKIYQPLKVTATEKRGSSQIDVVLQLPDVIAPSVVDDITAGWLRARLNTSLPYGDVLVRQDATGQPLSFIHQEGLLPAAALVETNVPAQATTIDLNQPFYPFGEAAISEQSGRYFYLNLNNIYKPQNAVVGIGLVLGQDGVI